jgi:hypothetical protein
LAQALLHVIDRAGQDARGDARHAESLLRWAPAAMLSIVASARVNAEGDPSQQVVQVLTSSGAKASISRSLVRAKLRRKKTRETVESCLAAIDRVLDTCSGPETVLQPETEPESWMYSFRAGVEMEVTSGRPPTKGFMLLRHDLAALPWLLASQQYDGNTFSHVEFRRLNF